MTAVAWAATTAALSTWLFASSRAAAEARLRRLRPAPIREVRPPFRWPTPRRAAVVVAAAAVATSAMALGPGAVVPTGLAAGECVRRLLRARGQRVADVVRRDVAQWCASAAGELHVGRTPAAAMSAANDAVGPDLRALLAPVAGVAALGGDVSASLRAASECAGAEALRYVGACWHVAADAGAGLATALHRLGNALGAGERVREEVTAQLAAARASARVLAVLPVFGLLLGAAIGAKPVHFLLHRPVGAACAALTVVLDIAGLAWTDRIAARVTLP
jgi:tight adherence protein B